MTPTLPRRLAVAHQTPRRDGGVGLVFAGALVCLAWRLLLVVLGGVSVVGDGMHAPHVLDEEIFAVEVVGFVGGGGGGALVAAPVGEAHVLGVDVAFPLVLGAEGGGAAVGGEGTGEGALVRWCGAVVVGVGLGDGGR